MKRNSEWRRRHPEIAHFGVLTAVFRCVAPDASAQRLLVVGPSGSGKTTLLRCFALLEKPSEGRIVMQGTTISTPEPDRPTKAAARAVRSDIGMVFQHFNLWPHMSVLENLIEAPIRVKGMPRDQAVAMAEALLAKVDLSDKRDAYPARLSGGQQQRVAIARALVNTPKMLLADEPTGALDSKTSVELMALFQQLNREGMTIVVVTHEPDVARYASRLVRFKDGRVLSDARQRPADAAKELGELQKEPAPEFAGAAE
jgi:ABC-type polar amino acid transport system ATPase subunit